MAFRTYDNVPYLTVLIDGRPARMVIDTGSVQTVLNSKLRSAVLKKSGVTPQITLKVGDLSQGLTPTFQSSQMLDELGKGKIDGLLGLDFFSGFTLGLDFRRQTIRLWPASVPGRAAMESWNGDEGKPRPFGESAFTKLESGHYGCELLVQGGRLNSLLDTANAGVGSSRPPCRSLDLSLWWA